MLTDQQAVEIYALYRYTSDRSVRKAARDRLVAARPQLESLVEESLALPTAKGRKLNEHLIAHEGRGLDVVALARQCLRWTRQWPGQGRSLQYTQGNGLLYLLTHDDPAVRRESLESIRRGGTLDLSGQELGSLPLELAMLPGLKALDISRNRITGSRFPRAISEIESLEALSIRTNGAASFPSVSLPKLLALHAGGNRFRSLPKRLSLPSLQVLDLSGCNLAKFPDGVLSLEKLQVLDLSHNRFEELPAALGDLKSLRIIRLFRPDLHFANQRLKDRARALLPHCTITEDPLTGWDTEQPDLGLAALNRLCAQCLVETPVDTSTFDGRNLCADCLVGQDQKGEQGELVPEARGAVALPSEPPPPRKAASKPSLTCDRCLQPGQLEDGPDAWEDKSGLHTCLRCESLICTRCARPEGDGFDRHWTCPECDRVHTELD